MMEHFLEKAANWRDELHNRVMLDLLEPSQLSSLQRERRRKANTWKARLRRGEQAQAEIGGGALGRRKRA